MITDLAIVAAGFFLLIWGADKFVAAASSLARKLGVSPTLVGLTVVAFGTSLPELSVSLTAAFQNSGGGVDISVGNVTGSNLFNLLPILGCCALFCPVPVKREILLRDTPVSLAAIAGLAAFAATGTIGRVAGFGFLAAFSAILFWQIKNSREESAEEIEQKSPLFIAIWIAVGAACIIGGGNLTVKGASDLAAKLGMSERLIGLTIVAVGTSLPELVTSIVASFRHENEIAVGNVIGSNIFNVFLILGATAAIHPLQLPETAGVLRDCAIVAAGTLFFIVSVLLNRSRKLGRIPGFIMLAGYVAYIVWQIKG